jgi:hypothetical protein
LRCLAPALGRFLEEAMMLTRSLVAVLLSVSALVAQSVTGSISGVVLDRTSMAVVQAKVTLTNEATGIVRTAPVESTGDFVFASVAPGRYTVTAEAEGFKKAEVRGVALSTSDRLSVGRIVLDVGAVVEKVVVQAQVTPVEVENSDRSGIVTAEQMARGMTRNRNLLGLVAMLPGAVLDDASNILEADNSGTAPTPTFGGVSNVFNSVMVDGVTSNGNNTQYFNAAVTMEAVEEVKVLPNNFKAEYGRNGGTMILAVTKQGTSQFKGTAFYYMRNDFLNANSAWNNFQGVARPKYRYNTWGGSLTGPVYIPGKFNRDRNKLFFMFSEEAQPRILPQSIFQATMPTAAERAGDFSQSVDTNNRRITITDPLAKAAFPNNVVPASRIYQPAQNLLNMFPQPNFFNTAVSRYTYNYLFQETPKMSWHQEVVRLDYNATDKLKLYGRAYTGYQPQEGYFGDAQGQAWPFLYSVVNWQTPGVAVGGTYTATPTVVLEFSAGFIAQSIIVQPGGAKGWDAVDRNKLGVTIPQIYPANNPAGVVPTATFGGVSNAARIGVRKDFPDHYYGPRSTSNTTLSKVWGPHTFKVGLYAEKHRYFRPSQTDYTGSIAFDNDGNNALNTGYAYSNALTGAFRQYTEADQHPRYDLRMTTLQWFAQDTWKVTRRLTLDVGMRFAWAASYHQADGNAVNWQLDRYDRSKAPAMYVPALNAQRARVAQNPLTGELYPLAYLTAFVPGTGDTRNGVVRQSDAGVPSGFVHGRGVVPSPRFGFAWDVAGDGKTAIRGGVGYTVSATPNIGFTGVTAQVDNVASSPTLFYGSLTDIRPGSAIVFPSGYTTMNPDLKLPSIINYSLGVQRAVGFGTVVEVAYVASLGRQINQNQNLNTLPYGARFLPSSLDATNGNRPLSDTYLYPYLGLGGVTVSRTANSNYQSLQTQANRRFSHGLQFGAVYTWSKSLGYSGAFPTYVSNRLNYGKTSLNRDHSVTVNWLYDLPKASRLWNSRIARVAGDGWQMSGIAHFQTGRVASVTYSRSDGVDAYGGGDITNRPMILANPNLARGERSFSRYFNTDVFSLPAAGQIGTSPLDAITGPGKNNWDLSLYKNFKLHEKKTLQFRWELYNAFNHASWSGVNTSARFDAAGKQINATFGQITGSAPGRIMQGVLRFSF